LRGNDLRARDHPLTHNSGADAKALLQGLITNDMSLLDEGEGRQPCISVAFLNPKVRRS